MFVHIRTVALGLAAAVLVTAGAAAAAQTAGSEVAVSDLRVNDTTDPLGIDDARPGLSWRLTSAVNGERQTAYRILVAGSPGNVVPGAADVWDTGSAAVAYGAGGQFKLATLSGGTACGNAVFGDPVPGTGKAWYVQ